MSKYDDKVVKQVKEGFQRNKGKGSIFLYEPVNIYILIFNFIISIKNKTPNANILIITDTFEQRQKVVSCFDVLEEQNKNYYLNKLTILSKKFANTHYYKPEQFHLAITAGLNDVEDLTKIYNIANASKFTLSIITENKMNKEFTTKLREILPDIVTNISTIEARKAIASSPVEEIRCKVYLTDKSFNKYQEYDKFIKDSMAIFGDLDTVNKCRIGDINNKLSAQDVRLKLAQANGWSYDIDTTIEFMKQIDDIYNPNAIAERADTVFNIIRERRNLVLNATEKIDKIIEIVEKEVIKNKNNLIIISKSGEFAHSITESINEHYNNDCLCVDYHDCIPDAYVNDENGNPIVYKSGKNKGQRRLYKSKSLSSLYEQYFNAGYSKILSIKNSSSIDLKTATNTVILTSSLTGNMIDVRNRFVNVNFGTNTKVYRIYCTDTIEETELINEKPNNLIMVKNEEIENIGYDTESGEVTI